MRMLFGAAPFALALACAQEAAAFGGVYFDDDVTFTSSDGTELAANVFIPVTDDPDEVFPAVVFINSWALEEHEYVAQAIELAEDGYVVLSYSARGWGRSGGLVTVAGPEDIEDLSASIDWLLAHAPVDADNVAVGGISYGAGIALLGLAREPRIKTVAAMSGWASLEQALYGGEATRLVWGSLLLGSGHLAGRMAPITTELFMDLLTNTDVDEAIAWARERSPLTYVDEINARGAPVYLSNNFSDEMFRPDGALDLYSSLTVPRRLDLNQGIHGTAELPGLLGVSCDVWDNVHDWFDYWLKGIDNGVMERPPVTMEIKRSHERVGFEGWPSERVSTRDYYLGPRGLRLSGKGTLETVPNTRRATDSIASGLDSGATTGVPVVASLLDAHVGIPVTLWTPAVLRRHGVVYETPKLVEPLKLRGSSRLSVWVTPSRKQAQLVAYLYDEDTLGTGTLITHGVRSLHEARPGEAVRVTIDLAATAYDVPAGHRVALVIDTFDPLYQTPTLSPYEIELGYSGVRQSVLSLSHAP